MKAQQVKQTLKKFKPLFPTKVQRAGVLAWRKVEVPVGALIERRAIVPVHRVLWPAPEVADFQPGHILGPAAGECLVDVAYTLISPGTERGQFMGLPGIYRFEAEVAFYPGYSGAGVVLAAGKGSRFKTGDRVAGRIHHASRDVVNEQYLFAVPPRVALESAAFIELGIICLQGIHKAQIQPGESALVLGQGLIGQLTNRLARLAGAAPIIASARSRAKSAQSISQGAADRFLTVAELQSESPLDGYDVVFEATGDPDAIMQALALARTGGRVIGLGTPRGQGRIAVGKLARPGVTFIGAHISGMPIHDHSDGRWTYREEGELFLNLLNSGQLVVDDLISHHHDPAQASDVYEALRGGDGRLIALIFDWQAYREHAS